MSEFASANGQITGVETQFNQIRFLPVNQGRWLNELDDQQKRNVIVLGEQMTKNLFPGRPAIGASILLNGIRFEVIGRVRRVGRGDNNSTNTRGYIPYQVMSMYFPLKGEQQRDAISFINYQPRTQSEHELAVQEVRKAIARNQGFDDRDDNAFEMWDTIQQSEMIGAIFDAMNLFLGGVGMVTLALGAIGVINIMLVSVNDGRSDGYPLSGSIWLNYEVNDYQGLERTVRSVMSIQHKFNPADRRALLVFSLMDQVPPVPGDYPRPENPADIHWNADAGHRWSRRHEYHARFGDPADTRDRYGKSSGVAEERCISPVSC